MRTITSEMTPRERQLYDQEREMFELQAINAKELKELDIKASIIEAKITSWFRLPVLIVKLPVMLVMAVGYCIAVARGKEPSDKFWQYMK